MFFIFISPIIIIIIIIMEQNRNDERVNFVHEKTRKKNVLINENNKEINKKLLQNKI